MRCVATKPHGAPSPAKKQTSQAHPSTRSRTRTSRTWPSTGGGPTRQLPWTPPPSSSRSARIISGEKRDSNGNETRRQPSKYGTHRIMASFFQKLDGPLVPAGLRLDRTTSLVLLPSLPCVLAEAHWTFSRSFSSRRFLRRAVRAGSCWRWTAKTARTGPTTAEGFSRWGTFVAYVDACMFIPWCSFRLRLTDWQ